MRTRSEGVEPRNHLAGALEDVAHVLDNVGFLCLVCLIDANGVRPEIGRQFLSCEMAEGRMQIVLNEMLFVVDGDRVVGSVSTPNIRQSDEVGARIPGERLERAVRGKIPRHNTEELDALQPIVNIQ